MRRALLGLAAGGLIGVACTLLLVRSGAGVASADEEPVEHAGDKFCMDANGDGVVNIADATFTLGFLFLGRPTSVDCSTPPHEAPQLVAEIATLEAEIATLEAEIATLEAEIATLEAELERRGTLPATSQTKCFNTDGTEISCGSADHPGQDGFYQIGCPSAGRYTDNADGTVTDTCTGLMWQKGTVSGTRNWAEALQECESLRLAGYEDWRLPNVRELQSIVDYGRFDPSIDPIFGAVSGFYWTSTTPMHLHIDAWVTSFINGDVGSVFKTGGCHVRAVRTAQ